MQTGSVHIYDFGEFQLDPTKRLLRRLDGTPIPLTSRVFETLLYLVEHHDAVLDKERIMEAVWPDSIVEENNLAQAISKLRQVFGETPGSHNYIVTVPGRGYRFVAKVTEHSAESVSAANVENAKVLVSSSDRPEADVTAASPPPHVKTGWLLPATISVIALTALGIFFFLRYRTSSGAVGSKTSSVPARAVSSISTAIPEKSVAVLPFDNLSDDKQNAFFAAGVQDEIISDLARIADLKVISRTSANLYKSGNPRNSREIGEQLGVAHLLEGNVQRIGKRLRVNAQLIDTRTDTHSWAQTYDRNVADLFAVQSDIAQAIVGQLQAKISPAEKRAIEQPPTADLTAFEVYIRAKNLLLTVSFGANAKDDLLRAADLLNQAVRHDPSFFRAYCELAVAQKVRRLQQIVF